MVPLRTDVPIYLAAMGPRNVALAPRSLTMAPILFDPNTLTSSGPLPLRAGFDIAPMVLTAIDDDVANARDEVRHDIALYVGRADAEDEELLRGSVQRYGFEAEVEAIPAAALDRRMADATTAVTDAMVDALALVGPVARVRDRLQAYAEAGATSVLAMTKDPASIRSLGEVAP